MAAGRLTDDVAVLDRLVPATTTIDLLAAAYAERDPETPMKAHRDAALHSLLKRLAEGVLAAWSTCSHFIYTGPVRDGDPPYDPNALRSYFHEEGPPKLIPPIFWQCLMASEPACKVCDLVTGDFSFEGVEFGGGNCSGSAFTVCFDRRGLPAEAIPTEHFQLDARQRDARPRLPDSKLKKWWECLGPKGQAETQGKLVKLCRATFPSHHISRQRIRDLTGRRTPGRPAFSGKMSAN